METSNLGSLCFSGKNFFSLDFFASRNSRCGCDASSSRRLRRKRKAGADRSTFRGRSKPAAAHSRLVHSRKVSCTLGRPGLGRRCEDRNDQSERFGGSDWEWRAQGPGFPHLAESMPQNGEQDGRRADLNRLLIRLDADPAIAWEKYRGLQLRLVKFFEWNQCSFPEELADEVLDRIARKPQEEEIRDVSEFVIGVARNLRFEAHKRGQRQSHLEDQPGGEESLADPRDYEREMVEDLDRQNRIACLRGCLENLRPEDRSLALDYYSAQEEKQKDHRKRLASIAGISMIALRVRANRLREKLERCVASCLESRRRMSSLPSLSKG